MVKQQNAIRHCREAVLHQLVQIAGAKIERETNQRGELVISKSQAKTIDCTFRNSQILLQEILSLLLRNGLALLDALSMPIADRPDADAVLVGS